MRILITGGAGFIGSHTADALLAEGHRVRVLDSLEEPVHKGGRKPSYLSDEIEFIHGDVRHEKTLLEAMRGCEAVYHLAAFQDYLPIYSRFFDVNVTSTGLIYELIQRENLPVRKVITASSQATLGEGLYTDADGKHLLPGIRSNEQLARSVWEIQAPAGSRGPLRWQRTDETIANPQNPYGLSKIAEENITLHIGRRCGIPSVALRYSIVQGPRQSFYNVYSGACRVFCLSFFLDREPPIYEDGEQIRDYVNIKDVVDANLLVLRDERADFQMFNVGGDHAMTVKQFASAVAEAFGRGTYHPQPCGKYRFGDTRHICSDVSKLKALGWKPLRSVTESIDSYKAWLESAPPDAEVLSYANRLMEKLGVVRSANPV